MASDPIPGMESVVASVSGYRGSELVNLIELMTHTGASYIGTLSPSNAFTHMVCRKFEGKRYEVAKKLKLIIVNHRWIEDCVKHRKRVPEHPYTLQSGQEVGPLLLKVPLVAKPGFSVKKGKAVSDKSHVFGDSEEIIDLGCGSSRRGVSTDSRLLNENLFPDFQENNSSQKRQNKSVKTNSKKESQSSSRDCFEDPPLSRSLRMEEFCRHSVRAQRNITSDTGTSMTEIPHKKRRLVKKNIGCTISVLSESDRECHPIRFHSIRNDRVTILSDDSNDELDTGTGIRDVGRKGVDVGGNHLSTSKDPNFSVVDEPTAPEGTPQNGCPEVENSKEELEIRLDREHATKSPSQELSCVICWTDFSTTRGILPCGHRYCYSCIENWADQLGSRRKISTCPLCKASFTVITKVDDAVTSDQNIFSQTIPSAPKVDISFLNDQGTSNFAAQSVSANGCSVCNSWEPEELLISCNVCQIQRIHTYCQDPFSTTWTCIHCKDLRMLYRSYHQY
ncbi:uncharacterized protein LOC133745055 isoform X1 [Rosa rugosa]|uniref:uncharacterized protein LOC133745055 isoform X1 n=1 Tax=Rosa rugosa TaxID=74645 RepID=UPI002B401D75|nr:uncharacterized protein LOC133745055 isoform X1 [Rosa rugosa]